MTFWEAKTEKGRWYSNGCISETLKGRPKTVMDEGKKLRRPMLNFLLEVNVQLVIGFFRHTTKLTDTFYKVKMW